MQLFLKFTKELPMFALQQTTIMSLPEQLVYQEIIKQASTNQDRECWKLAHFIRLDSAKGLCISVGDLDEKTSRIVERYFRLEKSQVEKLKQMTNQQFTAHEMSEFVSSVVKYVLAAPAQCQIGYNLATHQAMHIMERLKNPINDEQIQFIKKYKIFDCFSKGPDKQHKDWESLCICLKLALDEMKEMNFDKNEFANSLHEIFAPENELTMATDEEIENLFKYNYSDSDS